MTGSKNIHKWLFAGSGSVQLCAYWGDGLYMSDFFDLGAGTRSKSPKRHCEKKLLGVSRLSWNVNT